jgi:hypothetical protein
MTWTGSAAWLRVTGGDQVRYVPLHPALREELRAPS